MPRPSAIAAGQAPAGALAGTHRVGRLLIEAEGADWQAAAGLESRIREIARARLPKVIERLLDRAAADGHHIIVPRIELDLGTLGAERLEEDLPPALARALEAALQDLVREAGRGAAPGVRLIGPRQARLDAFETFLRSGRAHAGFAPDAALQDLIAGQPAALAAMLRRRARERHVVERLVLQAGPEALASLIRLLAPADAAAILAIVADVVIAHRHEPLKRAVRLAEPALERLLWTTTLEFLLIDAGSQFNRRRWLERLLRREAERVGLDWRVLLDMLGRTVARVRKRTGFRSSLPVVLADLLAEQGLEGSLDAPPEPGGEQDLPSAMAAAVAGDFDGLLLLLRRRAGDRAWLLALVRAIGEPLFEGLVRRLEPAHADAILALLGEAGAAADREPLGGAARGEVAVRLRATALHYLVRDAGTQFNRRRFLDRLLRREAVDLGIAYPELLAMLAASVQALAARRPLRSSLPVVLVELLAENAAAGEAAEAVAARPEDDIEPEHAADVHRLIELIVAAYTAAPAAALDAEALRALLGARAAAYLDGRTGGAADRGSVLRELIRAVAERVGRAPDALAAALRAAGAGTTEGAALAQALDEAGAADPRAEIEAFLRSGKDAEAAGRTLAEFAADDPAWLAALVRRIAAGSEGAAAASAARLLDWLAPDEIARLLAPGRAEAMLAAFDAAPGRSGWRAVLEAWIAGAEPTAEPEATKASRTLTLIGRLDAWLRGGAPAGAAEAAELDRAVEEFGASDWATLLLGATAERTASRVRLLLGRLSDDGRGRLVRALAPWVLRPGGALAPVLARLDAAQRLDLEARAVAAMLAGATVDLAALALPVEPEPTAVAAEAPAESDAERLIAWLEGGKASAAERHLLVAAFRRLAAAGDPALVRHLRGARGDRRALRRWAALLPPDAIGQAALLVAPPGARAHVEAALLIAVAARRAAGFGSSRDGAAAVWNALLDLAAAPALPPLAQSVEQMVSAASGSSGAGRADVLAHARRLAAGGGAVPVAAAIRRIEAARPAEPRRPRTATPPSEARTERDGALVEGAIYIGNAGLVIAAPYLPTLFDRLGVLSREGEDGKAAIRGLDARSRAVHLLQYLVDGRLDAPEHELALNKLLCGMAVAEPVARSIEPAAEDIETCDGLLAAIVANWPMIAGSSVAALRETFLQREGRLVQIEQRWDLVVQRRALDVMVDRIPWSFSMIFHPWMAEPIQVAW